MFLDGFPFRFPFWFPLFRLVVVKVSTCVFSPPWNAPEPSGSEPLGGVGFEFFLV